MNLINRSNVYSLDDGKRVLETGRCDCPNCNKGMVHLKTKDGKRDEFYCGDCHVSVPLFK